MVMWQVCNERIQVFYSGYMIFKLKTKNKETNIGFKIISTCNTGRNYSRGRKFCQAYGWRQWSNAILRGNKRNSWDTSYHFDEGQYDARTFNFPIKLVAVMRRLALMVGVVFIIL